MALLLLLCFTCLVLCASYVPPAELPEEEGAVQPADEPAAQDTEEPARPAAEAAPEPERPALARARSRRARSFLSMRFCALRARFSMRFLALRFFLPIPATPFLPVDYVGKSSLALTLMAAPREFHLCASRS